MIALPEAFVQRMRCQLADELPAFLRALEEPPARGIRLNPFRPSPLTDPYRAGKRIPWEENGFLLPEGSPAGSTLAHEAGAFYLQEPSAMLPARVMNAAPGERLLDLCAAPGGKATQLGIMMGGDGLLVCNEPVPKRAEILRGNLERMGIPNAIVTCHDPEALSRCWPEAFDGVLVDAPCSGEGMFRRDPETRREWTAERAEGCAGRQREILRSAQRLVRPGGRLVYSTCTYHPAENEKMVEWFLASFPDFQPEAFSLPGMDAPEGMATCFPHRVEGEGQFVAKLRRAGGSRQPEEGRDRDPGSAAERQGGNRRQSGENQQGIPRATAQERRMLAEAFPAFPEATHRVGNLLIRLENPLSLQGIHFLRAGLPLAEIRGKTLIPDHSLAMAIHPPEVPRKELTPEEACRYLAGEALPGNERGWLLMTCAGLALGWGKGSDGSIRNHYPKGLRKVHLRGADFQTGEG